MDGDLKVGDRLDSVYGREHRGTIVDTGTFADGVAYYVVERDSDEFRWIGWNGTVRLVEDEDD
jgi:hypothetical protein